MLLIVASIWLSSPKLYPSINAYVPCLVLCTLVRTSTIIKIMFLIFVIKVVLKYLDQVRASGSYTRRQRGRKTLRNNGLRQPYSCKKH